MGIFPNQVNAAHPSNLIQLEWVISIKEKDWDTMESLIQPKMEEIFTNKLTETIFFTSFNLNKQVPPFPFLSNKAMKGVFKEILHKSKNLQKSIAHVRTRSRMHSAIGILVQKFKAHKLCRNLISKNASIMEY